MADKQRHTNYKNEKIERAIKELDGYRATVAKIRRLKERRLYLEDICTCGIRARDYTKVKVKGGLQELPLVKLWLEWADLDVEISRLIVESERDQMLVENRIKGLPTDEQNVLIYYFFNGKNIDQIALIINPSRATVKRLKKKGLQHYAEVMI